ncbi:MAG: hypothetical protein PVH88_27405 [Ignavibacteria bacterium]|jgi:hypothetical protein
MVKYHMRIPAIIFFIFFISACNFTERIRSDEQLKTKIEEVVLSGEETLNFNDITEFDWNNLVIFTPYSSIEKYGSIFNIDVKPILYTGMSYRDDVCLLVFLKNNKIINVVEYPRYPGDFSNNEIKKIGSEEAEFEIKENGDKTRSGKSWIVVQLKQNVIPSK